MVLLNVFIIWAFSFAS